MTHDIANPTHLYLNKRCEFWYNRGNVAVPMGHCQVKQLGDSLDRFGTVAIEVQFSLCGIEKHQKNDIAKMSRRMAALPPWYVFSGFRPKVVDGHELPHVMTGRLYRTVSREQL